MTTFHSPNLFVALECPLRNSDASWLAAESTRRLLINVRRRQANFFSFARRFVVSFFDLHPGSSRNRRHPTLRISVDSYADGAVGPRLEGHGPIRVELERPGLRGSR